MMQAMRDKTPARLGSAIFETAKDYRRHEIKSLPSNTVIESLPKPSGDLLILEGQSNSCRVTLAGRPSGTEPKIKFYLFARTAPGVELDEAKSVARRCLADLELELKQWLISVVKPER